MVRPYNFSTATACVFTDTFIILPDKPKKNKATTNCHIASVKPIDNKIVGYANAAMRSTLRLPNLVTMAPEMKELTNKPNGNASNTLPSWASFSCSLACTCGMRLAQLANVNPAVKKNTATAMRWLRGDKGLATLASILRIVLLCNGGQCCRNDALQMYNHQREAKLRAAQKPFVVDKLSYPRFPSFVIPLPYLHRPD